ncbi:hypothetical protein Clacol_001464 [Clathrus columnatus]|uniref:Mitochondrial genome maintenance protein MGM101 n=1 Tax=Clathrus columnatus TaxID=1419009 RepID=A0AAV5A1V0_9AGAM|nr:hypothetical protein Clacol_001464 [Clathrus columnatus]
MLLSGYMSAVAIGVVVHLVRDPFTADPNTSPLHALFIALTGAIFALSLGSFVVYHFYLITWNYRTNQTTFEHISPFHLLRYVPPPKPHIPPPPSAVSSRPNLNIQSEFAIPSRSPDSPLSFTGTDPTESFNEHDIPNIQNTGFNTTSDSPELIPHPSLPTPPYKPPEEYELSAAQRRFVLRTHGWRRNWIEVFGGDSGSSDDSSVWGEKEKGGIQQWRWWLKLFLTGGQQKGDGWSFEKTANVEPKLQRFAKILREITEQETIGFIKSSARVSVTVMLARCTFLGRAPLNIVSRSNVSRSHITRIITNRQRQHILTYATTSNSDAVDLDVVPEVDIEIPVPSNGANMINGNSNGSSLLIPEILGDGSPTDWSKSYFGLSAQPFPKEAAEILQQRLDPEDIEIKPDGLIYLPEIKYRRILNKAFGPGGWGLAPRSETNVGPRIVSREYALVCLGRLVGISRGEQEYFDPSGIPTATEACKSNALIRDPRFIRKFKEKYCVEVFVEHIPTKKKGNIILKTHVARKKLWRRKDDRLNYPWKE